MKSLTLTVLRTIAEELPHGGGPPTFTVDQIIAKVWDRNWKALREDGFTPDDVRAIAIGAWNYAESSGWSNLRDLWPEAARSAGPMLELNTTIARAGILDLPSGRWAWIAPRRDGFVHVSLQMIGRPTERMEGAVKEDEFSIAEVDRIARDPSIRWWGDAGNDVIWEVRTVLRMRAGREVTFTHATLGTRAASVSGDLRLGELTDAALRRLLDRAVAAPSHLERGEDGLTANA